MNSSSLHSLHPALEQYKVSSDIVESAFEWGKSKQKYQ